MRRARFTVPALGALVALSAGCYDLDGLGGAFDGGVRDGDVDPASGDGAAPDLNQVGSWRGVRTDVTAALRSLWSPGPDEVWVVGPGSTVLHVTGTAVAPDAMPPGYGLRSVFGATVPRAIGDNGAVLRRFPDGWHDLTTADATLYAQWGTTDDDYFVAGSGGLLTHVTAAGSVGIENDAVNALFGLYGRGNELWAAGQGGALIHVVGDAATTLSSGVTSDLYAVFADATQVVVVGAGGVILRSTDGVAFAAEASGTKNNLYAVFGTGGGLWAAGEDGTIAMRDASAWTVETSGRPTLRALGGTGPSDLWAAGDQGTLMHRVPQAF